jgi:AbrB family looped-hinge helix DNA binding protein
MVWKNNVILDGMTHRIGTKGQVVIPIELRTKLGLEPGDEVEFRLDGSAVVMERSELPASLMGKYAGTGLTADLEAEHRAELQREVG